MYRYRYLLCAVCLPRSPVVAELQRQVGRVPILEDDPKVHRWVASRRLAEPHSNKNPEIPFSECGSILIP